MRLTGAAHMVYDVGMTSTAAFYPSEIFIDNVVGDMRRLADGSWVTLFPGRTGRLWRHHRSGRRGRCLHRTLWSPCGRLGGVRL
jgi:hypothetical protein